LEKSKFYKAKIFSSSILVQSAQSYIQASKYNIKDIVKIKENFSKLFIKKIEEVHKVLNNIKKEKPKLNITTKSSSRKQIIIPMSSNNLKRIMAILSKHIANINRALKDIKSDIMADFL